MTIQELIHALHKLEHTPGYNPDFEVFFELRADRNAKEEALSIEKVETHVDSVTLICDK